MLTMRVYLEIDRPSGIASESTFALTRKAMLLKGLGADAHDIPSTPGKLQQDWPAKSHCPDGGRSELSHSALQSISRILSIIGCKKSSPSCQIVRLHVLEF